jgi:hypothetical protein
MSATATVDPFVKAIERVGALRGALDTEEGEEALLDFFQELHVRLNRIGDKLEEIAKSL